MEQPKECPICGNTTFVEHNTRPNACCQDCRSLERTRLMWLIVEQALEFTPDMRILHFAPEACLAHKLYDIVGDNYMPCDVDVDLYNRGNKLPVQVQYVDMCYLHRLPAESYDLILHNHVLEHTTCPVEQSLYNLQRVLRPSAQMFFSVPFRGNRTREDLNPDLSPEKRREQFGQEDHMRLFGREDFLELLVAVYGEPNISWEMPAALDENALDRCNIPTTVLKGITGETIFRYRKPA